MSTTRTGRFRAGWFTDRPLAVKLSAVVGLMALVAVGTAPRVPRSTSSFPRGSTAGRGCR